MAKQVGDNWPTVGMLVELFTMMGCELRHLPGVLRSPAGETHKVRYLFSPDTGDFVSLSDLADDERLPPSEVKAWERRLGMNIPLPN